MAGLARPQQGGDEDGVPAPAGAAKDPPRLVIADGRQERPRPGIGRTGRDARRARTTGRFVKDGSTPEGAPSASMPAGGALGTDAPDEGTAGRAGPSTRRRSRLADVATAPGLATARTGAGVVGFPDRAIIAIQAAPSTGGTKGGA